MNTRSMSLSEVVGVMEQSVKAFRGQRDLQISVGNSEINDGFHDDEWLYSPAKFIYVNDLSNGTDLTIVGVMVRVQPDLSLTFSGNDDAVGMLLFDEKGEATSNPQDVVALAIADRFVTLIGRQYFFERKK